MQPVLTSFNAGEWSPEIWGRHDNRRYPASGRKLENFIPRASGALERRPGFGFIQSAKVGGGQPRLIPFQFSADQAYMIEAGDQYFRFYKDGGRIESPPGTPVEIATPYLVADLPALRFEQSNDVLYLAHQAYAPRKLTRTSHVNWTLTQINFDNGPWDEINVTTTTLTASAATGPITITASAALFTSADVGRLVAIRGTPPNWALNTTYARGDCVVSWTQAVEYRVYRCLVGGTSSTNDRPMSVSAYEGDGSAVWEYAGDGKNVYGWARITGFTSATQVSATVIAKFPTTAATADWRLGTWKTGDYPGIVRAHQGRLWFASSVSRPQTVWGSTSNEYENFRNIRDDGSVRDDFGITATLAGQQVNSIRWLGGKSRLSMGTLGVEYVLAPAETREVLSPSSAVPLKQTTEGSAAIEAVEVNTGTLFVKRDGRKILEFAYAVQEDQRVAGDLTQYSEHMTRSGIVAMAWQASPWKTLWAARADGALIAMTYDRPQEVNAWSRHPLGNGKVRSLATIPGPDGDELWAVIERVISGATKYYIERLCPRWTGADGATAHCYLDSAISYAGAPLQTPSNLGHLEGQVVGVVVNGAVHPDCTVSGGAITLQAPATSIKVGLKYTSEAETCDLVPIITQGQGLGRKSRITRAVLKLYDTIGGMIGRAAPGEPEQMEPLTSRVAGDAMDAPPPIFSGDKAVLFPAGWDRAATVRVRQDQPLPFNITAVAPDAMVNSI